MLSLTELLAAGTQAPNHLPWPRVAVDEATWRDAGAELANGTLDLTGLWSEGNRVHLALCDMEGERASLGVLSLDCPNGRFPSIGACHPAAIRLERTMRDLGGPEPEGAPDARPWLDHGCWPGSSAAAKAPYPFLAAEGEGLHRIPVGPVHAGIIEPGHFRFTVFGETVVRLEARLGYVHRGLEARLRGASLEQAARLAGRASGDSTVAYALAFCQAAEAALGFVVPVRAVLLRGLMAELERLANHFGDIGAIANDASFAMMLAQCGVLRERVLRLADELFGHRLMMDRVVPGGVAVDPTGQSPRHLRALIADLRRYFPALVQLYDRTASLQDRTVGTGIVRPALAARFGAGGFVGRASGRAFDARQALRYPPYDRLEVTVPVRQEGDVNARVWIRILEIEQSFALIENILDALPEGPILAAAPARDGEGLALVESFRGDVLAWVRLEGGLVAHAHLRDPSWFQWPLLEAAIEGNIVADFPLCNKSFNCSYAGHDL